MRPASHHHGLPRLGVVDDLGGIIVETGDERRREHLARGAVRHQAPVLQHHQPIGVARRQVEVVQHHQHGGIAGGQGAGHGEQLVLVLEIEGRGGLVEQQQPRLLGIGQPSRRRLLPDLGQYPGELHPLALPAGEAGVEATRQVLDPGMGHGGPHYLVAAAGGLAVGQPPHGHHLLAQEGEAQGRALGQHPDPVGQGVAGPALPLAAEQGNAAFIGQLAGQALEQRALARPVRAEQGSQAAPMQVEIQVVQDEAIAPGEVEPAASEQGGSGQGGVLLLQRPATLDQEPAVGYGRLTIDWRN